MEMSEGKVYGLLEEVEVVDHIPTANADPVVVNTNRFLEGYKETVVNIYDQMVHRATLLEERAKELRNKAEAMVHQARDLTYEMKEFTDVVVENHVQTSALNFVGPKGEDQ
jgi:hypothetical protein